MQNSEAILAPVFILEFNMEAESDILVAKQKLRLHLFARSVAHTDLTLQLIVTRSSTNH